jgi:hypothetical protein
MFFCLLVAWAVSVPIQGATQHPDGRIIFAAAEAKVPGKSAGDAEAEEITWMGGPGSMSWDYKPTRWGMYDLELVHMAQQLGAPINLRVELGEMRFQMELRNTGEGFQTSRVARVYLENSKPFTLALKSDQFPGDAMLKLRKVTLAPAPEGMKNVQVGDKIVLPASNAITHSVMMRYEPATNKNCLGYWTNPNDAAEWTFEVKRAGSYRMEIWQGCGKGQGGSEVAVELRGGGGKKIKEVRFVVEDTGHFQNFVPRDLGEVRFERAGEYSLWVKPVNKKAAAVLDIRQVVLAARENTAAVQDGSGNAFGQSGAAKALRLARFDIDATPPVGSHLAYDPVTNKWDLGLRARGIVLLGAELPIVLCAVDWLGIANEGHDAFREAIAQAAGTTRERVAVHALHQHDAPDCDFGAEKILKEAGMDARQFEGRHQREVLTNLAAAVRRSLEQAQPITHLGLGKAKVEKVASNRRIFGADGKVRATRYTACTSDELRNEPEGVIDPELSLVSFWNEGNPVAVLTYYATHPQSYYRLGIANPDFPGVARFFRQLREPAALHVHFNGAGGNIGAGKYNDGAHTNRLTLAERMAAGMREAWENSQRERIGLEDVGWMVEPVTLQPAKHLSVDALEEELKSKDSKLVLHGNASRLAWLRRCIEGRKVEVGCLRVGKARILHMPGELFVEYQLAAKAQRPDLFVAMAAYGDYGPWYIGTAKAYEEGGYETQPRSSNVGPEAEAVLMDAIRKLLKGETAEAKGLSKSATNSGGR